MGATAGQTDTFTIAPTSNRMTQITNLGIGYGFDAAGNRTTTPTLSHTYNAKGRLTKTVVSTGGTSKTLNFLYNALEQRVRKTGASGFTAYVYDDAGQLIGEYDNLGRAQREYVWLPAPGGQPNVPSYRPIALITYIYTNNNLTPTSKAIFAIEADHLGAPRRVSSAANQTRWTWTPAPFGDTLPNENPSNLGKFTLNLRFPGQYFDQDTNLTYNHHRYYEATGGRYNESDPIGLLGGINTYAYVGGNPVSGLDPNGLFDASGVRETTRLLVGAGAVGTGGAVVGAPAVAAGAVVVGAGAAGVAIGLGINRGFEYLTGDSIGGRIYDLLHPQASISDADYSPWSPDPEINHQFIRDRDAVNDIRPTPYDNPDKPTCDEIRARIKFLEDIIARRVAFTNRWYGGVLNEGHEGRIATLKRDIERLRARLNRGDCKPC